MPGAAPLAAITLFLAAALVAGFGFHAGEAAREAEDARAAGDLARRVEAGGIRAADVLRTGVEATGAGGDASAVTFPAEVRDVPWRTQDDDAPALARPRHVGTDHAVAYHADPALPRGRG